MHNLDIRPMELTDVADALALELSVFGKTLGETMLRHDVLDANASYYVVETDVCTVGFAGIRIHGKAAEVTTFVIEKSFRRQGIGDALMKTLHQRCVTLGVKTLTLEVRVSNRGARTFYRKHGFSVVGTRKHYYQDGEDAVLMLCPIGGAK